MVSTGLEGLDKVINGLRIGDNVVWQIDNIEDYDYFVQPFVAQAKKDRKKIIYIRFANHRRLLEEDKDIKTYKLNAFLGFENFSTQLNNIITDNGPGVYYVFDCLSDLLFAWANDLMIGNLFKIFCPYLFELDTIAYFSLLRNDHSYKTVARIRETTQLLIDVYNYEKKYYVHPLKVWNRYSPTMFLPHLRKNDRFIPIANSVDTARLFSNIFKNGVKNSSRSLDYWDRFFLQAESLNSQAGKEQEKKKMVEQLCKIMIAGSGKLLDMARDNFSLTDMLNIKSRMIGTGFVGGKSVGMLLARNLLLNQQGLDLDKYFEPHDSFYIGSDVFYAYIVENGWWKLRMEQKTKDGYFRIADILKDRMLKGVFPDQINEQFQEMIDYFGQSPIIVRSSSLLEDGLGNAFAGKYESIFLVNQGSPQERFHQFVQAVCQVYASTMNKDALAYRLQRGLDKTDEQMALLVQRVSGSYHKNYFFPDMAGVGISYNLFVWQDKMDPTAGMLRIVAGLGTRAVNRVSGDYPRIVALDVPLVKPHAGIADTQKFSQHDVDLLNIKENELQSIGLKTLIAQKIDIRLELLPSEDKELEVVTFDSFLKSSSFAATMQRILKILEKNYGYPVDVEFTVNFAKDGSYKINLLQCRTIQTKGLGKRVDLPKRIASSKTIFKSRKYFLGGNIMQPLQRIIYVHPQKYAKLATSAKYDIARAIGELNQLIASRQDCPVMLVGPGRWGTTTPSLGVGVSFAEINNMSVLVELGFSTDNCTPELSFGTHFFQDLVETGIFYLAIFPDDQEVFFNTGLIDSWENLFPKLSRDYAKYKDVIKVYDFKKKEVILITDILSQKAICYIAK